MQPLKYAEYLMRMILLKTDPVIPDLDIIISPLHFRQPAFRHFPDP
jgi:hypothetical protein